MLGWLLREPAMARAREAERDAPRVRVVDPARICLAALPCGEAATREEAAELVRWAAPAVGAPVGAPAVGAPVGAPDADDGDSSEA